MRASLALLLSFFVLSALASAGDRDEIFQKCVAELERTICTPPRPISILSRLTSWHCVDECKYECMHAITDLRQNKGEQMLQYYGKWPFWRVLSMQEPASVAFSVLNFLIHLRGARLIRKRIIDTHPMKKYYVNWSYISMNAWIWSSVFHTRDLPATEKLDYFSAAATILYAFYAVVVRFFHIYPLPSTRLTSSTRHDHLHNRAYITWTTLCALILVGHITYLLSLPRFDYTYNMAFGVGVGVAHNILWATYSLPPRWTILRRFPFRPKDYRPAYAIKSIVFVTLTMAATGLEVFDFPPWRRTIDAHSLWHLATVPLSALWYDFLLQDAMDEGWRNSDHPQ